MMIEPGSLSATNTAWTKDDCTYMAEAIRLARKGLYTTEPNPRVGCVIVNKGKVVGRGWHQKAGEGHAEVNALAEAGAQAKGAMIYVSLEPCSHFGRTPPCAQALIDAGVSRVIAAMQDPNPCVSGQGFELLKNAGIEVAYGLMEAQARELNPGFIKRMSEKRPWVRVKMALSVDGRTAMASGESQWITGPEARSDVQRLRARSSAILTGSGTVLQDDAALTVRAEELGLDNAGVVAERQPLRVVLDSEARIGSQMRLFAQPGPILWVVSERADVPCEIVSLQNLELVRLPDCNSPQRLKKVLGLLAERGCNELLVEAGASLAGSFLQLDCWDELIIYMAPVLMGSEARALATLPLKLMSEKKNLALKDVRMVGNDIKMTYHPAASCDEQ